VKRKTRTLIMSLSLFIVVAGSRDVAASSTASTVGNACVACWGSCDALITACHSQCGPQFIADACDASPPPYCSGGVEVTCQFIQ